MSTPTAIADWVVAAGLAGKSEPTLLDGFCHRALDAGLPLARAGVIIDTLHPVHEGRAFLWRREGDDPPELLEYGSTSEGEAAANWRASVFYRLLQSGESMMRVPLVPGKPSGFARLDDFAAEGMTEYLGLISRFASDGTIGEMDCVYAYWMTDRLGGFTADEVQRLAALMPSLALAVNARR